MEKRIESLDVLKGLGILAVIIVHFRGNFLGNEIAASSADIILLSLARFAVPIFFLTSGFLLKKKFEEKNRGEYIAKYLKKLVYFYILATALYLAINLAMLVIEPAVSFNLPVSITSDTSLSSILYNFFYTGYIVRPFLWFFPALIISSGLVYLSDLYGKINFLLGTAVALHITGIAINTYQMIELPIPPHDALFFGLIYVATGFKFGQFKLEKYRENYQWIVLAAILFTALNIVETFLIPPVSLGEAFFYHDYTLLTYPFALSVFLLALSRPKMLPNSRIATYGKHTLLGYIFHLAVGSFFMGLTILAGHITGYPLMQSSLMNIFIVLVTYIATMEGVTRYNKR